MLCWCEHVVAGHARTKDGMENNYVKSFMVLCRVNGCLDLSEAAVWEDAGQFSSNGGGSERQEHRFDMPRHARYVRFVGRLNQHAIKQIEVHNHVSCLEGLKTSDRLVAMSILMCCVVYISKCSH